MKPLVSILVPAYNAGPWVGFALRSILNQSYDEIDLLVIDDASTDNTLEEIARVQDPRLRVETNSKNLGLVATLNRALELSRGDFIGRMDADDLSPPERLARQLALLDRHPEIDLVSSGVRNFHDLPDGGREWQPPLLMPARHEDIVANLPFCSTVSHATCLMRRSVLDRTGFRYETRFTHAEDYGLWSRLALEGIRFRNLQEVHLYRRLHAGAVSSAFAAEQGTNADLVRAQWRERLGLATTGRLAEAHYRIGRDEAARSMDELIQTEESLRELYLAGTRGPFERQNWENAVSHRWWRACHLARGLGSKVWRHAVRSDLTSLAQKTSLGSIKLLLRSLTA